MISTLKGLVPSVEGAIDRHYYSCYGNGAIRAQQSGDVVVYVVSGDKFGDYLRNLYGTSVRVPSIRSDVSFNKVDIFGREWSGKFGYPFVESAFENSDFAFSGSFNCLNPGSLVTGFGTISNIGANFIEAKDQKGSNFRFNLGSCSRLEATKRIPEIGHKFYWSGVPGSQGYNLYGGSCFE